MTPTSCVSVSTYAYTHTHADTHRTHTGDKCTRDKCNLKYVIEYIYISSVYSNYIAVIFRNYSCFFSYC